MTHDQRSLLTAILADPADDAHRLKYADWCEENGEGERAAFIRVQCELAKREYHTFAEINAENAMLRDLSLPGLPGLDRRWQIETNTHVARIGPAGGPRAVFSRGFISAVTCSWADWQAHADKLTWWPARKCDKCQDGKVAYHDTGKRTVLKCTTCSGEGELPGATDVCPKCAMAHASGYALNDFFPGGICPACKTLSGRIPRRVTLAMQPITEVTLTTWPDMPISDGPVGHVLRKRWPSVKKWNLGAHNESSVRS